MTKMQSCGNTSWNPRILCNTSRHWEPGNTEAKQTPGKGDGKSGRFRSSSVQRRRRRKRRRRTKEKENDVRIIKIIIISRFILITVIVVCQHRQQRRCHHQQDRKPLRSPLPKIKMKRNHAGWADKDETFSTTDHTQKKRSAMLSEYL